MGTERPVPPTLPDQALRGTEGSLTRVWSITGRQVPPGCGPGAGGARRRRGTPQCGPNSGARSIRIRSSKQRSGQSLIAVKRHGWWYSIDATDTVNKLAFRLLETLISVPMAEAVERKATPVLTVPLSR